MCVQAPSPCALDRTAAWLLNMNSASSYGDADDDRHDDTLIEKVHFASLLYVGVHRLERCFGELNFFCFHVSINLNMFI